MSKILWLRTYFTSVYSDRNSAEGGGGEIKTSPLWALYLFSNFLTVAHRDIFSSQDLLLF